MNYDCPVCGFDEMKYPAKDYHICPCCGTEFGNDDAEFTHAELRNLWIGNGGRWFFGVAPDGWDPNLQLIRAGLAGPFASLSTNTSVGYERPIVRIGAGRIVRYYEPAASVSSITRSRLKADQSREIREILHLRFA
jgi:hypothetical protein